MSEKNDNNQNAYYVFGNYRLDVADRRLIREGEEIPLTRKAFDLLLALIEGAGRLQTRESLIELLWPNTIVEEHSLTWNVSALRKALVDTGDAPQFIETVRGIGYRFVAPIQLVDVDATQHFRTAASEESSSEPASSVRPSAPLSPTSSHPKRTYGWLFAALLLLSVTTAFFFSRQAVEAPSTVRTGPHSIAVLPFENLSPDPANAYFASGIQEIILTKLAGITDMRVLSRAATRSFESHPADATKVAAQLGVESVLTGSVQRIDDRVLINLQLADGRDGSYLWAESFPRTLEGVFEVESEVAENVADALKATLRPAEAVRVARKPTTNERAYDSFLKAEYLAAQVWRETASDPLSVTQQARQLYGDAIQRDPRFALAWARLAYLEIHAFGYRVGEEPYSYRSAEEAVARALDLDPDLPQARLAHGYVRYFAYNDFDGALAAFQRARRGMPEDGEIDAAIANAQRRMGLWEDSIASYERAAARDPYDSRWPIQLGDALGTLRRYDEALRAYDRARAADPGDYAAIVYKSIVMLYAGRPGEVAKVLEPVPEEFVMGGVIAAIRFEAARMLGDSDAALAAIAKAPEWIESAYLPSRIPVSMLRGQVWEMRGDHALARMEFEAALHSVKQMMEKSKSATLYSVLGMIEAKLGNKSAALAAGQLSLARVPLESSSGNGSSRVLAMADISISVGDLESAADDIRKLLAIPAGRMISEQMIRADPRFEPVRGMLRASGNLSSASE